MPDHRLPHQALYGQLSAAKWAAGEQKMRYKDYTKDLLKQCNINPIHLEPLALHRSAWQVTCAGLGDEQIHHTVQHRRTKRRAQRHQRAAGITPTSGLPCPTRG